MNSATCGLTSGLIPQESFTAAVAALPLVSLDLCLVDAGGCLLMGRRVNRPAQGYWFTPGCRIRKGETIDAALR